MKNIIIYLSLWFISSTALADQITINNQTNYPEKKQPGSITVQWVDSAEAVQKANKSTFKNTSIDSNTFIMLSKKGENQLNLPQDAKYFRIIVWNADNKPKLLTNWVDVVAGKTYPLTSDLLSSAVLMSGTGC